MSLIEIKGAPAHVFNRTLKEKQRKAAWHIELTEEHELIPYSPTPSELFRLVRVAYIEIGFVCQ